MAANLYQKSLSARPGYQPLADSPLVMDATIITGHEHVSDIKTSRWRVGPTNEVLSGITAPGNKFGDSTTEAYDLVSGNFIHVNTGMIRFTGCAIILFCGDSGSHEFDLTEQRLRILSTPTSVLATNLSSYRLEKEILLRDTTQTFSAGNTLVAYAGLSVPLTLDPSRYYYAVFCGKKPTSASPAGQAGFHRAASFVSGVFPGRFVYGGTIDWPEEGQACPSVALDYSYPAMMNVTFETDSPVIYKAPNWLLDSTSENEKNGLVPVRTDGPYCIYGYGSKASIGGSPESLTVELKDYEFDRYAHTRQTLVLDHTVNKRIAFNGNHVPLEAREDSADYYNFACMIDPEGGISDLWYSNLTTGLAGGSGGNPDVASQSHAVANANQKGSGIRGARYAAFNAEILHVYSSGGDSRINGYAIGCPPIAVAGNSQCTILASYLEAALGGRLIWIGYVSGSQFTQATASYVAGTTRYKGDPGLNDICEMDGAMLLLAGYGINDIGVGQTPAEYAAAVRQVLDDWRTEYGGVPKDAVLLGLPPVGAENAGKAVLDVQICQFNDVLRQAAIDYQIVFVDVYNLIQADVESYIESGSSGIHYTAAGAAVVAAKLADDCETGLATRIKFVGMSGDTQREMTAEWHPGMTVELRNVDLSKISAYVMPGHNVLVVGQTP